VGVIVVPPRFGFLLTKPVRVTMTDIKVIHYSPDDWEGTLRSVKIGMQVLQSQMEEISIEIAADPDNRVIEIFYHPVEPYDCRSRQFDPVGHANGDDNAIYW